MIYIVFKKIKKKIGKNGKKRKKSASNFQKMAFYKKLKISCLHNRFIKFSKNIIFEALKASVLIIIIKLKFPALIYYHLLS